MEATEIIINTLKKAGKPMKSGEIAEIAGIEKAEVDKVIKKLKKEEMIHSPKNCYYEVK
jgi:DNA-binding IscR family transcriptional regulator